VLGAKNAFYSTTYNTYISWPQAIYAESVSYFPDHIYFDNAGFGNTTSSSASFGVGVKNANLTISQITGNLVELDDSKAPLSTAYVFFYFEGSSPVVRIDQTNKSDFLQSFSSFISCPALCVFLNQTGHYLEVSNPAGNLTKNLVSLEQEIPSNSTETTTTLSTHVSTSSIVSLNSSSTNATRVTTFHSTTSNVSTTRTITYSTQALSTLTVAVIKTIVSSEKSSSLPSYILVGNDFGAIIFLVLRFVRRQRKEG
jgi:hypothetical protein